MLVSSHPAISQETQSLWDSPAPFPVSSSPPLSSFSVLGAGEGVCESPAHQLPLLKAATGPAGSLSSPCSLASCCDCWCHQSQLTKYMWSLNVLLVLTQDISRSARPALNHMGPSKFTDAPSHHLWHLSMSPAPPLSPFPLITLLTNPHPSEPRLFSAAYPGCQSTPNHILLCSSPAADPTRATHHAQDSGCLWESSHVSHWCIPVLSSNLPGLGPQLCPLWRSKGRGILHALWCSLRFINQHRQLNFKKSF